MGTIKNNQINSMLIIAGLIFCSLFCCSANVLAESIGIGIGVYLPPENESGQQASGDEDNQKQVTTTPQPGWVNQSPSSSNNSASTSMEDTVSGLTQANTSLKDKAKIVCDMGTNLGTAASLLMSRSGGGHSASDVAVALIEAGYDKSAVNAYLINNAGNQQSASQANNYSGNTVINHDSSFTDADVANVNTWLNNSTDYLSNLGYNVQAPGTINLGDYSGANYGSGDEWNLSSVDPEVITTKTAQLMLGNEYPDLGYVGIEAFCRVFADQILTNNGESSIESDKTYTYDANLEGLDGETMNQAYSDFKSGKIDQNELDQISSNVANNPRALFQSMRDVGNILGRDSGNTLIKTALENLKGTISPGGQDILNVLIKADQDLNAGVNVDIIKGSFLKHGIS